MLNESLDAVVGPRDLRMSDPELLLLDEPTSHLDLSKVMPLGGLDHALTLVATVRYSTCSTKKPGFD